MNDLITTLNQLVSLLEKGITINIKVEGLAGVTATAVQPQSQVIGNLIKEALEAQSPQPSLETASPSIPSTEDTVHEDVVEVAAGPQAEPEVIQESPVVNVQPQAVTDTHAEESKTRKAKKTIDLVMELQRKITSIKLRKNTLKAGGIEIPADLDVVPSNLAEAEKILKELAQLTLKAFA